jgi:hypothetical protein
MSGSYYSYSYYDRRLSNVEQRQGALDQRLTLTQALLARVTNGVNLVIVSLNRVGDSVLTGTMRMTDGIGGALDTYAGKLRKLSQAGGAPTDTMVNARHVQLLNGLRKDRPEAYAAMLTVAKQIPDLPTEAARDTLLYYFDPTGGVAAEAAAPAAAAAAAAPPKPHPRSVTTLRYFAPAAAAPQAQAAAAS